MYDPQQLLALIDANATLVLTGFGLAMLFQLWWLGDAVRVARRDQAYSIPLFCTFYWFAHDFACVIRFEQWFFVYDHWYLKLFWVGLLAANLLEVVFLWQALRYGRRELLPDWSERRFAALLGLGLLFSIISYEFFKYGFGDPLFQMDPTLTMLSYPAFGAALLIRRGSARGQSATMWWTFAAMTALFHLTTFLFFGERFQGMPYVIAALAATAGGVAMAVLVARDAGGRGQQPM